MQSASHSPDEASRLASLRATGLLDTPAEERFDRLTRLAVHSVQTPIAAIVLLDADRQWFKSTVGLTLKQTPRDQSICDWTVRGGQTLVVPDTRLDPRFAGFDLVVNAPHVRFYAGIPLFSVDGQAVGVLCVMDRQPRTLDEDQLTVLQSLARAAEDELQQQSILRQHRSLHDAIARAQSSFIREADYHAAFDGLLVDLLRLTDSGYGFIGEILYDQQGSPYLKTWALSNIAWDEATRAFYDKHAPQGLEFHQLDNLFGHVIRTGELLISNDPVNDARRGGLPHGHPPLDSFLGVPVRHGNDLVAMVGMANRARGYDQKLVEFLQPLLSTIAQLVAAERVKRARNDSERRLADIIGGTRIGTWEWNVQTGATVFNELWAEMIGYRLEELQPVSIETWLKHAHQDDLDGSAAMLQRHFSGELPFYDYVCRMRHRDGHWIWVHDRGRVVSWTDDGKPLLMSGSHADITAQREAADALASSEERFRALLQNVPGAAFQRLADAGLSTLYVSDAILGLTGYAAREFMPGGGRAYLDLIHPDDLPLVMAAIEQAIRSRSHWEVEYRLCHQDGRLRWVAEKGCVEPGGLGSDQRLSGFVHDISHRKQVEARLRDEAEHTQAILRHMVDGLITVDRFGLIESLNAAAERLFGCTGNAARGQPVRLLLPGLDGERHLNGFARLSGSSCELEGVRLDGTPLQLELTVSEVSRQGAPLYVGLVRDITERKRVERMKSEFISIVSHELRTPLTSISGALGLLAGGALGAMPAASGQLLTIAYRNSERLTFLINDLLDMEKLVAGKMPFDLQCQPLQPLLEQALENNRQYGAGRGVSLLLQAGTPEVQLRLDSQRFMQIMNNLLSNAIKYSPDGGEVRVHVQQVGDEQVRIVVADHGPGIPQGFQTRIFEKFAQADASDSRQRGGTGLGLAITRELVERMGGQIGFFSREGVGSQFFVEFPLAATGRCD